MWAKVSGVCLRFVQVCAFGTVYAAHFNSIMRSSSRSDEIMHKQTQNAQVVPLCWNKFMFSKQALSQTDCTLKLSQPSSLNLNLKYTY